MFLSLKLLKLGEIDSVKFLGLKIRRCKIFDKFHVCLPFTHLVIGHGAVKNSIARNIVTPTYKVISSSINRRLNRFWDQINDIDVNWDFTYCCAKWSYAQCGECLLKIINLLRSLFVWETLYYCLSSDILWTMIWHAWGKIKHHAFLLYCGNLAKSTRCSNLLPQEPPYLIKILQSKLNATEIIFSKSFQNSPTIFELDLDQLD